jgi:hypothetical protein
MEECPVITIEEIVALHAEEAAEEAALLAEIEAAEEREPEAIEETPATA